MKTKQCNKCNKETKLAFKCEHCGAIQQWTMSEQLGFFKGLSNIKKGLYIGAFVIVATVSFQIFSGFETNSASSSSYSSCRLSGCNSTPNGWRYYTGSDLGAYSYSCVSLGPSTGHSSKNTYCSKNHCIQDR